MNLARVGDKSQALHNIIFILPPRSGKKGFYLRKITGARACSMIARGSAGAYVRAPARRARALALNIRRRRSARRATRSKCTKCELARCVRRRAHQSDYTRESRPAQSSRFFFALSLARAVPLLRSAANYFLLFAIACAYEVE